MKITLNNRPEEFDAAKMTVRDLLQAKNFTFKLLVIKINKNWSKKTSTIPPKFKTAMRLLFTI